MRACVAALFFSTQSVNGGKNTSQRSAINNVISHPLWETTSTEGGRVTACSTRRLLRGRKCSAAEGGGQEAPLAKDRRILCVRSTQPRKQHQPHARSGALVAPPRHHPNKMKGPVLDEGLEAWRPGGLEASRPQSETSAQCDIQADTSIEQSR